MTGRWGVLVGPESRDLRRRLRPVEWVVLEDVALDVVLDKGRAVAATSARRIADNLGIDPGAVSSALRRLRSLGLLEHDCADGNAGRFGLAVYVLVPTPGIELMPAPEPGPTPRPVTRSTDGKPTKGGLPNSRRTEGNRPERTSSQSMPRRAPRTPRTPEPSPTQLDLNGEGPTSGRPPR